MSKNIEQVYVANPITTNASTDLMYFGQSPYVAGNDAAMTYANFSAQFGAPYTAAALTKVDDTNVTITLGGTPATALLHATSLTMGWTGQLGLSRGGTHSDLSATGGTSQVLKQTSVGGNISVAQLAASDLSNGTTGSGAVVLSTSPTLVTPALGTPSSGTLTNCTGLPVAGGGTGDASFTAYSVLCGGTTSTGALQNVSGVGSANQVLVSNGASTLPTWQSVPGLTPAALTEVNDTNVTLTLGGTPNTALLQATSMTLGWTGTLSGTRGGTGINNGSNTATFAGNLDFANSFTTSGNFAVTQTYTNTTNVTFPTSGTLATTSQLPTPAALTSGNDTNVTLTLGGTPATALLQAASVTAGWTGTLSLARGGTAANLTASNGGIFYSTGSAGAILSGTATAGQLLTSGASTTPAWTTTTYPLTNAINTIMYASSANVLGVITPVNSAVLVSSAGGVPSMSTSLPSGLTIPGYAGSGANSDITSMTGLTGYLQAPLGIKSSAGAISVAFGYTTSAVNYLSFNNNVTGSAPVIDANGTDSSVSISLRPKNGNILLIDNTGTIAPALRFYNAATTHYTGLKVATAAATDVTLTLPSADATISGQAMISNASGVLSFSSTPISTAPVRTVYTSGSGNYTTASGVLWLEVEVVGGGAGGGSSGTAGQAAGTAGNNSTFGSLTANGGAAGGVYYQGGEGGSASGGDINIPGGAGGGGGQSFVVSTAQFPGATGGNSFFGGGGTSGVIGKGAGGNGSTNSGGGGGGGGIDTTSGAASGGGGGAGGYCRQIISPTSGQVFAYSVGAAANGASAGTNGAAGGNGAAGIIIVTAHYQ